MGQEQPIQDLAHAAIEAEGDGNLALAAKYSALQSLAALFDGGFVPSRQTRIAFGKCLRAISNDVRAGDPERARRTFELLEPAFRPLRNDHDDPICNGLVEEWYGDAYAMLRDDHCLEYYLRARDAFETHAEPGTAWGTDEEFDYAFSAFRTYAQAHDHTLTEDHTIYFTDRIDAKRRIIDDIWLDE